MSGRVLPALGLSLLALAACRQDMHDAPKYEPLEESRFFADGQASRPLIAGTVARGHLRDDDRLYRGVGSDGSFVTELPVEVDRDLLLRGRQRFEIYCSPCHGRTGDGRGMIVQRGFKSPQTFHQDRVRNMPVGYYFDVMTNGFGQMSSYASQVPVEDRWAIAAWVQTLQLARHAPAQRLSAEERARLSAPESAGAPHGAEEASE
ncbi:MAG: cytochrome c [Thermoanaerobaculia bacterium]